ncbi:hypothetical protein RSOLAG22IIIB_12259 [Rhizoctonia solani]|uniref:Fungal-type protein kinase domain-containing protein n=1 Tax=Rhizoctonia solani TaxID=456999 RepID=A0A0K6GDD8_9AGAM|nr:hypothetical protein RSOLAG22IIIB_12259 [Rhizoctonia solani]
MVAYSFKNGRSESTYGIRIQDSRPVTRYHTIRVLSDAGANSSVGRATRVWAVQKYVDGIPFGRFYSLKDVWAYEWRDSKHQVLENIQKDQPKYSQHFLIPSDYGYVAHDFSELSIPDNIHESLRRLNPEPTGRILYTHAETSLDSSSEGHTGDEYLSRHPRQHHRVVFEGIGVPVHDLRTFTDIFTAIKGGWKGLNAMHLSRLVHRDVSSGSILLVSNSGTQGQRGVIMDLECAKQVDDTNTPYDMRTGTETFMATEVACMKHHRLGSLRSFLKIRTPSRKDPKQYAQGPRARLPSFCHNPLHGMESIWWLCIWVMFYLVPSSAHSEQYMENYWKVFANPLIKRDFVCISEDFLDLTTHLSEVPSLVEVMSEWQEELNQLYKESYMEQDVSSTRLTQIRIDKKTVQSGYELGKEFLESLKSYAESISIEFVTLSERYQEPKKNVVSTTASSEPE